MRLERDLSEARGRVMVKLNKNASIMRPIGAVGAAALMGISAPSAAAEGPVDTAVMAEAGLKFWKKKKRTEAEREAYEREKAIKEQAAEARRASQRKAKRNGSVSGGSIYGQYGNGVFARGSYVFGAHTSDGALDVDAIGASFGYRRKIAGSGRIAWYLQPNIVWQREASEIDVVGVPIDQAFWGLSGLISARMEYRTRLVTPFFEAGIGPSYFETVVDDSVTKVTNGNLAAGYSGVVGFETRVTDRFAIETSYRYLGALREQAIGFHSAEIGASYRF